jgi:hypothetical protein
MVGSRVCVVLQFGLLLAAVAGCSMGPGFVVRDEPWRAEEERACLASGLVLEEPPFVTVRASLGGPSVCGALRPFQVTATARGSMALEPPALVRCPMVHAIEYWAERVVAPAARRHLRADVVGIRVAGSYSCRPMNGISGGLLSEHGHANAVDISGFVLGDGRVVTVRGGWHGSWPERIFLRDVHRGSCNVFTTVLGPGYDRLHHDHLHLDLARHTGDGRICK